MRANSVLAVSLCLLLAGCTTPPAPETTAQTEANVGPNAWTLSPLQSGAAPLAAPLWQHFRLPGKQATDFSYRQVDGRHSMAARADASASMLRQQVHIPAQELGHLRFSWKVPELIAQADMAVREADDSPVRVVLAFEGDRSRFSAQNAMLSELLLTITGEPLPYATLMYVWCNKRPAGSVIINPRTDRIRKLVMESGARKLNQWLDYERDIRADFEHAFGEPPGALVAVAIMTDSDNTRSVARAWYGPLTLTAAR